MGRKRKLIDFEPLKSVTYHKEMHHTCTNPIICKDHTSPSELCSECRHYKLQEVDVADDKIRFNIDWGF